jgi:Protein of unknown function (DUF3054)
MPFASRRRPWPVAVIADLVAVSLFAAIGRANHGESTSVRGVWHTALPFLVGAAVGLALSAYSHLAPTAIRAGVRVWVCAVVIGLVVRNASGGSTPVAFVIVAAIMLGVFLIGWRALLAWSTRRGRGRWRRLVR